MEWACISAICSRNALQLEIQGFQLADTSNSLWHAIRVSCVSITFINLWMHRQSFGIWRNTLSGNVSTLLEFPSTMIAWAKSWKIKLVMPGSYAPFACGRFERGSRYSEIKAPWSRTETEGKFTVSKFSVKFLWGLLVLNLFRALQWCPEVLAKYWCLCSVIQCTQVNSL